MSDNEKAKAEISFPATMDLESGTVRIFFGDKTIAEIVDKKVIGPTGQVIGVVEKAEVTSIGVTATIKFTDREAFDKIFAGWQYSIGEGKEKGEDGS